jgi:parallel beta-helix repeat protein
MKKMTGLILAALVVVWGVASFAQTILKGGGSTPGVVVQGDASQSANLQEWKNSTGTVVASVDPNGKFTGDASGLSGVDKREAISTCGTISQSGSYYVTHNLSTTGTCITVTANDVTIDLNGFTLTGDGSIDHYGVHINNVSNVEVRNGTVRSFYNGIFGYYSDTPTKSNRVISVRAMGNGSGILLSSYNNLVKDCTAADSTTSGAYGYGGIYASRGSTVINNTAYNNQGGGIGAEFGSTVINNAAYNNQGGGIGASDGSTVANNTAVTNNADGISVSYGCTVTNNTVLGNYRCGIYADDGSTVTNNTVRINNQNNNTYYGGIHVWSGCVVKNNTLRGNYQNNIYVKSSDNTIEENLLTGSVNGIYFFSGGNFYANNRASGNTTANYNNNGNTNTDGGGNVGF